MHSGINIFYFTIFIYHFQYIQTINPAIHCEWRGKGYSLFFYSAISISEFSLSLMVQAVVPVGIPELGASAAASADHVT